MEMKWRELLPKMLKRLKALEVKVSNIDVGGGGSGGGVNGKVYFADQSTGSYYVLKVADGKLTMEETTEVPSTSPSGYISMYDENAQTYYELKVIDGKLTLSEVV